MQEMMILMNYRMIYPPQTNNILSIKKIISLLALLVFTTNLIGQGFPRPDKNRAVQDYIGLLSSSENNSLNSKLKAFEDTTSTAIVVAIISTTDGDNISLYAAELAQKWGIGQEGKDNGVLLLIAQDDREMTIQTGYGVQEYLTDAESKLIIENLILPQFKKKAYYSGIDDGTDAIIGLLTGKFTQDDLRRKKKKFPIAALIVILLFIFFMARKGGRGGGGLGHFATGYMIGSMGGSSFGGGGGGGGFGGFGGGGFGGGGASGSW